MNISEHITYEEAIHSDTAVANNIANIPNQKQLAAMQKLAIQVFEPLRRGIGNKPIRIDSFFRSPELNAIVPGSSITSQHMKGEAMDIKAMGGVTNRQLFDFIKANLTFDQLIWEYGDDLQPAWIHVSYCGHNRHEVLKSKKVNGKVIWEVIS